jgi:hypothetical protein
MFDATTLLNAPLTDLTTSSTPTQPSAEHIAALHDIAARAQAGWENPYPPINLGDGPNPADGFPQITWMNDDKHPNSTGHNEIYTAISAAVP